MAQPQSALSCVSNIFIKMMTFQSGEVEELHRHIFDHTQVLASGTVKITVNGVESVFEAPKLLFIAKNTPHQVEAVTDAVVLCVHGLRDGYGVDDIIDPAGVPEGTKGSVIGRADLTGKHILPLIYGRDPNDCCTQIETIYIKNES
jgi:5-deoxy-D-glucuronate isomerase